tara:strand:+ start:432 stop:665 length:234 start_codon:yes stop_codon:yes gene_type:complete
MNIDKKTEVRLQEIIDQTREYIQEQADKGYDLMELAQVMLTISREVMVDGYGEYLADAYIKNQITRLKSDEKSITLH